MIPQINLLHLKYFCDAVIHGSISESAKVNFVTQSTVSQAIAKLEVSLSAKILNHRKQKFHLTEEGKVVFKEAEHVFRAIKNITEAIGKNKTVVSGTVKFVTTNSLGMSYIAPIYKQSILNLPGITINYRLGGLNFIRQSLKQRDAEFAIVLYDPTFEEYEKQHLKKGLFNLYQSEEASLDQIENSILVDFSDGTHVKPFLESLKKSSSTIKIQTELAGWEVVARFTELNMGIGFIPDYILANNRYPNLKQCELTIPSFEYEICAIWSKGEKLSRAASVFLEQISI